MGSKGSGKKNVAPSLESLLFAIQVKYDELGALLDDLKEEAFPKKPKIKLCPTCQSQDFEEIGLMGDQDPIIVCTVCKNML